MSDTVTIDQVCTEFHRATRRALTSTYAKGYQPTIEDMQNTLIKVDGWVSTIQKLNREA